MPKKKTREEKPHKGPLKYLLNIVGINDNMINKAGGGGTTNNGRKPKTKTFAEMRKEAMGR